MRKHTSEEVRKFLLRNISTHPKDVVNFAAEHFGLTRQAIHRYISHLQAASLIESSGSTKARQYRLKNLVETEWSSPIISGIEEHEIWQKQIEPHLKEVPRNVFNICQFGMTEMLNNVIDHSEGKTFTIGLKRNPLTIELFVQDDGVGIFEKVKRECKLDDHRHAILELSKGKLTTDPEHHSGEGIFFTSRAFDLFILDSNGLALLCNPDSDDFAVDSDESKKEPGTFVAMHIKTDSTKVLKDVFLKYAAEADDFRFSRTHIPVTIAQYGQDNLISRSQAKRVLAGVGRFKEIILDFSGVQQIGQGFADEVFRVFARANPEVHLKPVNLNPDVEAMIRRVRQ